VEGDVKFMTPFKRSSRYKNLETPALMSSFYQEHRNSYQNTYFECRTCGLKTTFLNGLNSQQQIVKRDTSKKLCWNQYQYLYYIRIGSSTNRYQNGEGISMIIFLSMSDSHKIFRSWGLSVASRTPGVFIWVKRQNWKWIQDTGNFQRTGLLILCKSSKSKSSPTPHLWWRRGGKDI
jgi:hypothetical protein